MDKKLLFPILLIAVMLIGSIGLWVEPEKQITETPLPETDATLFRQARQIPDFQLVDHAGYPFRNSALKGRWHFLFAGYTHCPDVCPTTMGDLNRVANLLNKDGLTNEEFDVMFLSVDPERDTPEVLSTYVKYFNEAFIGLTGAMSEIENLSKYLGLLYMKITEDNPDGNYLMDHTTAILLINPQGKYQGLFSAPHDPEKIVQDFNKIRTYYEQSQP